MDLCVKCQRINLTELVQYEGYGHHQHMAALEGSAESCAVCRVLLSGLALQTRHDDTSQPEDRCSSASRVNLRLHGLQIDDDGISSEICSLIVSAGTFGRAYLRVYADAGINLLWKAQLEISQLRLKQLIQQQHRALLLVDMLALTLVPRIISILLRNG